MISIYISFMPCMLWQSFEKMISYNHPMQSRHLFNFGDRRHNFRATTLTILEKHPHFRTFQSAALWSKLGRDWCMAFLRNSCPCYMLVVIDTLPTSMNLARWNIIMHLSMKSPATTNTGWDGRRWGFVSLKITITHLLGKSDDANPDQVLTCKLQEYWG